MGKAIVVALLILAIIAMFGGLSKKIESRMKSHMNAIEELTNGK